MHTFTYIDAHIYKHKHIVTWKNIALVPRVEGPASRYSLASSIYQRTSETLKKASARKAEVKWKKMGKKK